MKTKVCVNGKEISVSKIVYSDDITDRGVADFKVEGELYTDDPAIKDAAETYSSHNRIKVETVMGGKKKTISFFNARFLDMQGTIGENSSYQRWSFGAGSVYIRDTEQPESTGSKVYRFMNAIKRMVKGAKA